MPKTRLAVETKMKKNTNPLVSILTVNRNGKNFLGDFFGSVSELNYPLDRIEVLMIDNCSDDGSVEFVKGNFPRVKIINSASYSRN